MLTGIVYVMNLHEYRTCIQAYTLGKYNNIGFSLQPYVGLGGRISVESARFLGISVYR